MEDDLPPLSAELDQLRATIRTATTRLDRFVQEWRRADGDTGPLEIITIGKQQLQEYDADRSLFLKGNGEVPNACPITHGSCKSRRAKAAQKTKQSGHGGSKSSIEKGFTNSSGRTWDEQSVTVRQGRT